MGFVRQLWTGRKLANGLLSGRFDDSPVAQQLAIWFDERPQREQQRQMFVQFATTVGCSSGILAERLMHCITDSWRDQGTPFGDALAREIDRLFTFDAPNSPQQADQQHAARKGMAAY